MKKHYDVIVCGGGSSGTIAAIAAARNNASVLLVEKNGFMGGANTASLVAPLMTFHGGEEQVIKGIPDEIVKQLMARGASPGYIKDPLGFCSTIVPFDIEELKNLYYEMVTKENIDLSLHTYVTGSITENNVVKGIECVNKTGKLNFEGNVIIDATGDGDIANLSGVECVEGREEDGLTQPMSLLFSVGGVDITKVKAYMKLHPDQFVLSSEIKNVEETDYIAVSGFFDIIKEARENNDFTIDRDRVLFFENVRRGEVTINMTRIIRVMGTKAEDLTKAETEGRRQVREVLGFLKKYVPGFENSYIVASGMQIGVRESRRIEGMYTLDKNDIITGQKHNDSIARGAFPIDIHSPSGDDLNVIKTEKESSYDIPYGVMLPKNVSGLLVTGRCISATHEALASARVSATAMALGQAAGTAAALAVSEGTHPHNINVKKLREILECQGASVGK